MENTTQLIREVINTLLAFAVIHYLFRYFYHLTLWDVVKWWGLNFHKVENVGAYAAGLFFGLLVYILTFSGFASTIYLGIFGEKQELIYLGHNKESTGVYYKRNDANRSILSAYDVDTKYNFSFDNLLRSQLFKKDPGTKNTVGTKSNRFTFFSFIGITCAMGSLLLAAVGIFHPFAFQVYTTNPTDISLPIGEDAMTAFDSIIAQLHLTRGTYFILVFGLFICFMGFVSASSGRKPGVRIEPLPYSIKPGSIVQGIPVEIKPRYIQRAKQTINKSTEYETVDSGDRYVNFKFNKGFPTPVYVATVVRESERHELLDDVEKKLLQSTPMDIIIDEDLAITLYREKQ